MDVKTRIENAKYILGFGRIAKSLSSIRDDIVEVNRVDEILNYIDDHRDILLLASGDPNFFGIVDYLSRKGVMIKEVLPGLSSFQYLMAKLQKSWHGATFLSLHGRTENFESIKESKCSILLIDKDNTPNNISMKLHRLGIRGKLYAGFNLSYENEEIIVKSIGEEIEDISSLGVVVIENDMD